MNSIVIKDYICVEINDIEHWNPLPGNPIYYLLDVYIGEQGIEGSTIFTVSIISPEALSQKNKYDKGYIVVKIEKYSFNRVLKKINELIEKCSINKNDSMEVYKDLSKHMVWEYE